MKFCHRIAAVAGAAVLMTAIGAAAHAAPPPTGFLFKSVKVGEKDYRYTIFVPRDYQSNKKWPLIMFLHGAGECGTDGVKQVAVGIGGAIMANVDRWPFIVVIPQKPDVKDAWEQHDDAVMAMLKAAEKDYRVETSRLYLTGLSQGGHGTWVIGGKHADVWAAIAPVCGYGEASEIAPALKTMPVWAFHGEADTTVQPEQSKKLVEAVTAEGGTAKLTTYPGVGHNSWDKAYRDEKLYDWFLEHQRVSK